MMKKQTVWNRWLLAGLSALLLLAGCKTATAPQQETAAPSPEPTSEVSEAATSDKSGEIILLFTSDIHCGVRDGIGMSGLYEIKSAFQRTGAEVILVDDGDAIQGDVLGIMTRGEAIIDLMNEVGYDVAIPGNHEFDYSADEFLSLTERANFPYISCNFNKDGELLLKPYVIKEAAGKKIGFVGVTTPLTTSTSSPKNFRDENGNYIYDFMGDATGDKMIEAIQSAVDEVRKQGVDYVVLISHLGHDEEDEPYNFQNVIERTSGIDIIVDGHSHDKESTRMNNKDGDPVLRAACGTKMEGVGYIHFHNDEEATITNGLIEWRNDETVSELLSLDNPIAKAVDQEFADLGEMLNEKIIKSDFDLTITDPEKEDDNGNKIRIVRKQETNAADLVADCLKEAGEAEIALTNGGGVRTTIKAGDITYGDVVKMLPFTNDICVAELSGQTIKDALEWGASKLPGENGGFMQVSGITYEIDISIPSSCTVDTDGYFASVEGEYRVRNIMVNGEPLDLKRTYRVAGYDFLLKDRGDYFGMFNPKDVVLEGINTDTQGMIEYLRTLGDKVPERYANPYGEGRITILGAE